MNIEERLKRKLMVLEAITQALPDVDEMDNFENIVQFCGDEKELNRTEIKMDWALSDIREALNIGGVDGAV